MTDPAADNEALLEQQTAREPSARTYPRHPPHAAREVLDVTITDIDGEECYDCLTGAGMLALGHSHPRAIETMRHVPVEDRPLHTPSITIPIKKRPIDTLFDNPPSELADSVWMQFRSPAETDTVEAALRPVKIAAGNRSVLGFQGGYCGMTNGAPSLMGDTDLKENVPGLTPDIYRLLCPHEYRCPFGVGDDECHGLAARYVERAFDDPKSGITEPAGMVVELVQGEDGAIPAPDDQTREMRRMTRRRDTPLVIDEIRTSLGRTDGLYAFEHVGTVPDAVTLSKAVGGSLPFSVVAYDKSLDVWEPGTYVDTFRKNQLTTVAGIATIEHVLEYGLNDHAARMDERLRGHLDAIECTHDAVGDVRGRGLMLGIEPVDPAGESDTCGRYPANPDLVGAAREACFDRGLILELGGHHGSVVRFLPPLVTSPSDVDVVGNIFVDAAKIAIRDTDADGRREAAV